MAQATAVVAFTPGGAEQQAFTWVPALTSNPPKVLACSAAVTDGSGPVGADLVGIPTNTGGTVRISQSAGCTVTLIAQD